MRSRIVIVSSCCLGILILSSFASIASAAGWPGFHHSLDNSRVTTEEGPADSSVLWTTTLPGNPPMYASPAIKDSLLYVTARDSLYCLRTSDGSLKWVASIGDSTTSSPAVSGCTVYVLSGPNDRCLYALNAQTGQVRFQTDSLGSASDWGTGHGTRAPFISSPIPVDDEFVYIGSRDGKLYCINTSNHCTHGSMDDGSIEWSTALATTSGDINSTPAYAYDSEEEIGRIVVGTFAGIRGGRDLGGGGVFCLDAADGDTLWYYAFQSSTGNCPGIQGSPTIYGDYVYVASSEDFTKNSTDYDGAIYRLLLEYEDHGSPPYYQDILNDDKYGVLCCASGTPVACEDTVFATTGRGLHCLTNDLNQSAIWHIGSGGSYELYSSATISHPESAEKRLYVTWNGATISLSCHEPSTGDTLWTYSVPGAMKSIFSSPAIADGCCYFCDKNGVVHCIGESSDGQPPTSNEANLARRGRANHASDNADRWKQGERATPSIELAGDVAHLPIRIRYSLPDEAGRDLRLAITDVSGRIVKTLSNAATSPGIHEIIWDGKDEKGLIISGGMYYCILRAGDRSFTKRLIVLK